jgi:hypothetical protein
MTVQNSNSALPRDLQLKMIMIKDTHTILQKVLLFLCYSSQCFPRTSASNLLNSGLFQTTITKNQWTEMSTLYTILCTFLLRDPTKVMIPPLQVSRVRSPCLDLNVLFQM